MAVHDGAAQKTAQNVSATLVGRQDAVGDHERNAASMVGDDAQAGVDGALLALDGGGVGGADVLLAGKLLAQRHKAAQLVGFEVALNALHDGGHALEAQTGVDVLGGKRGERAVFLAIVLGENKVPVLKEAVALAAGAAVFLAAAELGTLVVVQFGAGTARAGGAGTPEVVVLAQTGDVAFIDAAGSSRSRWSRRRQGTR